MSAKVLDTTQAALEKRRKGLQDSIDEFRKKGIRVLALQQRTAEETIARLRTDPRTPEAELPSARSELSEKPSSSESVAASLQCELPAACHACDVATTCGGTDANGNMAYLVEQNTSLDMERRKTIPDAARPRKAVGRLNIGIGPTIAPRTPIALPAPRSRGRSHSSSGQGQRRRKRQAQGQRPEGKKGQEGGKGAKPKGGRAQDKQESWRASTLRAFILLYATCTAKECVYTHARPETPEEKEHYKALYEVSSRSLSAAPKQLFAGTGRRPLPSR